MIGCDVIKRLQRNFKRDGRPSGGKNSVFGIPNSLTEKYDDGFLIKSGIFIKSRNGIKFTSEFIDKVYKEYPEVSIESQLESYGLDPKNVGYHRIYSLKKRFDGNTVNENISLNTSIIHIFKGVHLTNFHLTVVFIMKLLDLKIFL